MIYLDGVALEGFDPDVYEYEVILPEGTVFEPYMEALAMDDGAMVLVNPAFEVPGAAIVDIYAEDIFHTKRYVVNYVIATGVGEETMPLVQVYPNPVNGILYVNGMKDASVKMYSADGAEVISLSGFSGSSIDISTLPAGVYIMNMENQEGVMMRKKIIVY
jgi:hypothetical protein